MIRKPINHGKPWSDKDKEQVYQAIQQSKDPKKTIKELANNYKRTEKSISLVNQWVERKKLIEKRGIKKLIHFTDERNLKSIKKHGLLSVDNLKKNNLRYYYNDSERFEGITDGICVSITHKNEFLLKAFNNRKKRQWIQLEIDPLVIASNRCYFFDTNASNKKFLDKYNELTDIYAFQSMFAEIVNTKRNSNLKRINKNDNETTCKQAEIIIKNKIPISKIRKIEILNVH